MLEMCLLQQAFVFLSLPSLVPSLLLLLLFLFLLILLV